MRRTRALERISVPRGWPRRALWVTAGVLGLLFTAAPLLGARPWGRAAWAWGWGPLAILTGLGALAARRSTSRRPVEWLRVVGDQVVLQAGPHVQSLIDLARPIGVTVLANTARDRLLVAVSAPERTAYFAATIDPGARTARRDLLARANTLPDEQLLGSPSAEGSPIELGAGDLAALIDILEAGDPRCFDRCFLSDTHGRTVVLDGSELMVGSHRFDLHAPLEWRATVFQEPFGSAVLDENDRHPYGSGGVMVYQGTWLQQGMSEVVLVSLLSSLTAAAPAATGEVASLLARDVRLMQAAPEEPPPRDLRFGIERMFMLRIRAAVDRAPRERRTDRPSGATMR